VKPKRPVIVLDLFPEERQELLGLLSGLPTEAWLAPTACPGWTVKDLAAHLLAVDFQNLSHGRDHYPSSPFTATPGWDELVDFINRWNEEWVRAARRLSPHVLIELLAFGGERTLAYFASLDSLAPGPVVSWAGLDPAPSWLHVAREYTERWVHQEQIREAVGVPGLRRRRLFHPVLDTFIHALPRTYRDVPAPDDSHLELVIAGEAGGSWSLVRQGGRWDLFEDVHLEPTSIVTLDEDTAWRLFTRGIDRDAARARITLAGDGALGSVMLDTVAIIA
jgi:uncharacterized protein (TIGR03083 family)